MIKNLYLLSFIFFSFQVAAQSPEVLFEKTINYHTSEKIYLHFDKQSYTAGDTIWYKAYLLEGFLPARNSTLLNVEFIDDSSKIIDKKIIPIFWGSTAGHFLLASNLKQAAYTIRAFTPSMINFGTVNFYSKKINVYNSNNSVGLKNIEFLPEVKFFPEAGNLVAGVQNTIAFKCTDNNGSPLPIKGKILNSKNEVISEFRSIHDGMGRFDIMPEELESYYAECEIDSFTKKTIALPTSITNVPSVRVAQLNDKSIILVNSSMVSTDTKKPSYILGTIENLLVFKIEIKPDEVISRSEFETNKLPSGILKIAVFSKDNLPLAERLVFINSNDFEVKSKIVSQIINTEARKKNEIKFELADTTEGSYSIAITNAALDIPNENGVDNIFSRFLLTDNLKGKIHNPAYYFEKNDKEHAQHLDLVMLTNGWRRYSWTEIMNNKFPTMAFKDPNYISVSGTAFLPFSKTPLANSDLLFLTQTKDSMSGALTVETDAKGNFELKGMMFEDSARFLVQNTKGKDKRMNLMLTNKSLSSNFNISKYNIPFFNFIKPNSSQVLAITELEKLKLIKQKNIELLEEVKVLAKKQTAREKFEKKYVSGSLGNGSTKSLDFLAEPPTPGINIFDYIKNRLTGVNVTGGPLDYQLNYRNTRSLIGGPIPMAIYLDDIIVNADQVATMQAKDFALVKLFPNGGLVGPGGAIALYTNRDPSRGSSSYTNFSEAIIEGFSVTKEFYSPDYEKYPTFLKDVRSTLYWNPFLQVSKGSKEVKVVFFNSDNANKFKVVLEGMNNKGGLIHLEKIIEQ